MPGIDDREHDLFGPAERWKVGLKRLHAPGDTDLARDMCGSLGVVAE